MIVVILIIALVVTLIYAIFQKISLMIMATYLVTNNITPTDEELHECSEILKDEIIKSLFKA